MTLTVRIAVRHVRRMIARSRSSATSASNAARGCAFCDVGLHRLFPIGRAAGPPGGSSRPRRAQRQPARGPLRRALPRGLPAPAAFDGGPEQAARIPAAAPFFRLRGEPARAPARATSGRARPCAAGDPGDLGAARAKAGRRSPSASPPRSCRPASACCCSSSTCAVPASPSARGRVAGAPADRPGSLFSEVRHDERTGVDLILVEKVPDDASAILSSEVLADTVQRLRRRYDHVVVDSAPVLGLSDAKVVSRLVDATILAVRCAIHVVGGGARRDRRAARGLGPAARRGHHPSRWRSPALGWLWRLKVSS